MKIAVDEVHAWSVWLTPGVARASQLAAHLSPEEKERAGRILTQVNRQRFVVGRAVLHMLVGDYIGVDVHRVRFELGAHGKPYVAGGLRPPGFEFNYSQSADVALYAFAQGRSVGIDVERIQPLPDMAAVASTVLSPGEKATLFALPETEQLTAFYQCWTRKEAYLKATGQGLSADLGQFDVSLAPGQPARLLSVRGDAAEAARWSLQTLEPAAGYTGALAVEGHHWHLVYQEWAWDPER